MKQQVLDLIRSTPNIRTVEISDRLDIDVERVRPLVDDEIKAGVIVAEPILAPNGHKVESFRFQDAPSKAVGETEPASALLPRVLRTLPPGRRPAAAPVPVEVDARMSRVERAVALVYSASGPVHSNRLGEVMGLRGRHPSDYLRAALAAGHLTVDGNMWSAGPVRRVFSDAVPEPVPAPAANDSPAPEPAVAAVPMVEPTPPLEIDVPVTLKTNADLPIVRSAIMPEVLPVALAEVGKPTKVDLALQCLRVAGGLQVPTSELALAMGLTGTQHPSSYLRAAINDGRVVMRSRLWALGPAARSQQPAPNFPRADAAALAAYVPGSKRCTMNCGPHADDPRSAAERALLCDECDIVASGKGEPAPAAPVELPSKSGAERVGHAEPDAQVEISPALPCAEPRAASELVAAAEDSAGAAEPLPESATAGIEHAPTVNVSTPAPSPRDDAAERFLAGVMSDGSLHLCVPGMTPFNLAPSQARELWELLRRHDYTSWQEIA